MNATVVPENLAVPTNNPPCLSPVTNPSIKSTDSSSKAEQNTANDICIVTSAALIFCIICYISRKIKTRKKRNSESIEGGKDICFISTQLQQKKANEKIIKANIKKAFKEVFLMYESEK